jgi:hypothetical protein
MNLKAMKLDRWMVSFAKYDQGIKQSSFSEKLCKYEQPYMTESYPRLLLPSKLPNNQYAKGDDSWFVFNGVAYKYDASMFKYCLGLLNNYEEITRTDKIYQLRKLEIEMYGEASEKTRRIVGAISNLRASIPTRKRMCAFRKRIKHKIKDKKESNNEISSI